MTPFRPVPFSQAVAEVPETPDWLVDRLVVKGSLGLVAGDPKAGKSEITAQAAVAVAQGSPFLGRPTVQSDVLIIVAEEMRDDAVRRLQHFGLEPTDPERVWLWTETVEDTEADRRRIREFISERENVLVIIDTLTSYLLLTDETNNSVNTARLKPYVDLAHETGATFLFIHHLRKNRDDGTNDIRAVRGGSSIAALADAIYQLQKGGGTKRKLSITSRYRDVPRSLLLDYPGWPDGEYVCLGPPEEHASAARREKAVAVLPTTGAGLTVKEVVERVGMKPGATRRALEDARTSKGATVMRTGKGTRSDPHRYVRTGSTTDAQTAAADASTTAKAA